MALILASLTSRNPDHLGIEAARERINARLGIRKAPPTKTTTAKAPARRVTAAQAPQPMTFEEIGDALKKIAADPNASDEDRNAASRMLRGIEQSSRMAARMGVPTHRATIRREGRSQVFETMTPEQAKAHLARRAGR